MARIFLLSIIISGAALLGACFDKPAPACAFWCGTQGACPDGYRCAADEWCKREDVPESHACGPGPTDAAPADAGPADASPDAGDAGAGPVDAALADAALPDAVPVPAIDAAPPDAIGAGLR